MSVQAAQLMAVVSVVGADEAEASLIAMGAASDAADISLENTVVSSGAASSAFADMYGVVDLGALSFEEFNKYTSEANIALGIWSESTGVASDTTQVLSASIDSVDVASSVMTESIASADVALTGMSTTGVEVSASLEAVTASEEEASAAASGMSLGLGLVAVAAVVATGAVVKMAIDHQAVMSQTATVIKSTGDASGMSAQQINGLADSLSHVTDFSNDTIQSGENMLLTFTNIGSSVFPQATKTALDMATALKEGPTQASMMLGKALNDPLKGITALTRVGVTFTDSQKKMIAQMVAAGDTAGAQGVILKELQREFGGSAEAAGKTFGGQLDILKNKLIETGQNMGTALLPSLSKFTGWVSDTALPVLDKFGGWFMNTAVPAMEKFGSQVGQVFTYVGNVLKSINLTDFKDAWQAVSGEIAYVSGKFGELIGSLNPLSPLLKQVTTDFDPVADIIANLAKGALNTVSGLLWNISGAFIAVDKQVQSGKGPLVDLGNAFSNIAKLLGGEFSKELKDVGKDAQQVGQWFMTSVVPAFKQALPGFESLGKTILTTVIPAFIQIRGVVSDVIQHAFQVFAPIIEKIIPPLIVLGGIIAGQVSNALKFLMPYVVQAAKAIGDFAEGIMDRVAPIITNVINGITPVVQNLFKFWQVIWPGMSQVLQGVFNVIVGVVKIAWSILTGIFNIALDLISGNWKGAWNDMKGMLGGIWDGIKTMISGAITSVQGILTMIGGIVQTYLVKPFQDALGTIGGVFSAIGKLVTDASTLNFGAIPGDLHNLGIPGFASGTSYAPGGWAMVGEQGPEAMYVPRGSQIVPNNQLGSIGSSQGGGSGQAQPVYLQIDGRTFAKLLLPALTNQIRYGVGVHNM